MNQLQDFQDDGSGRAYKAVGICAILLFLCIVAFLVYTLFK